MDLSFLMRRRRPGLPRHNEEKNVQWKSIGALYVYLVEELVCVRSSLPGKPMETNVHDISQWHQLFFTKNGGEKSDEDSVGWRRFSLVVFSSRLISIQVGGCLVAGEEDPFSSLKLTKF